MVMRVAVAVRVVEEAERGRRRRRREALEALAALAGRRHLLVDQQLVGRNELHAGQVGGSEGGRERKGDGRV